MAFLYRITLKPIFTLIGLVFALCTFMADLLYELDGVKAFVSTIEKEVYK